MGAMGADHGPPQLSTVASVPELGAEAMPPLWQYFSRVAKKGVEPIAAPKGGGFADPRRFPLQTSRFLGATTGAMMRSADPSAASLAVMVGAGPYPPLCQYFSRLLTTAGCKRRRPLPGLVARSRIWDD
jgi:hypothetical protein